MYLFLEIVKQLLHLRLFFILIAKGTLDLRFHGFEDSFDVVLLWIVIFAWLREGDYQELQDCFEDKFELILWNFLFFHDVIVSENFNYVFIKFPEGLR